MRHYRDILELIRIDGGFRTGSPAVYVSPLSTLVREVADIARRFGVVIVSEIKFTVSKMLVWMNDAASCTDVILPAVIYTCDYDELGLVCVCIFVKFCSGKFRGAYTP